MDSRGYVSVGLAGLAGFLIFLGGWSVFSSSVVASEIGVSTGWFIEGVPVFSFLTSFLILFGGVVCAYFAWWYSPESWSSVKSVLVLVLVVFLIAQIVYAYSGVGTSPGGGNDLPPSDGGNGGAPVPPTPPAPPAPKLSGWFRLSADDVALSGNVPFDIWFNRINLGQGVTFSIDAKLDLENVVQPPPLSASFGIAVKYSKKTSSGWSQYVVENIPVKSVSVSWTPVGGNKYSASVSDLKFLTLTGHDREFLDAYDGRCRFVVSVYGYTVIDGRNVATGVGSVSFELRSTMGNIQIEGVSGWAE